MPKYRFITRERIGKWYTDLQVAKRFAHTIGAGFYDHRSGKFVAYKGTRLEVSEGHTTRTPPNSRLYVPCQN